MKTKIESIDARQRAQTRGGKIFTTLKGGILTSRSFVHLENLVTFISIYCLMLNSPIRNVIANSWRAENYFAHLKITTI